MSSNNFIVDNDMKIKYLHLLPPFAKGRNDSLFGKEGFGEIFQYIQVVLKYPFLLAPFTNLFDNIPLYSCLKRNPLAYCVRIALINNMADFGGVKYALEIICLMHRKRVHLSFLLYFPEMLINVTVYLFQYAKNSNKGTACSFPQQKMSSKRWAGNHWM